MGKPLNKGRWTAEIEGDFVVFLIGARFNKPLRIIAGMKDLSSTRGPSMQKMLDYLVANPEKGLLGYEKAGMTTIQYWRSFEHLEAFAKDKEDPHLEAWRVYMKRANGNSRVGIWHETYLVRAGEFEAIYGDMPTRGLAKASKAVSIADSSTARNRIGRPAKD